MDRAIEAVALTRLYGRSVGVQDIDLTIASGECFGFLGPNGAGKTTFIRLALGLIRPTSGAVSVMGHDLARDRMGALAQVGYLPGSSGSTAGSPGAARSRRSAACTRVRPSCASGCWTCSIWTPATCAGGSASTRAA